MECGQVILHEQLDDFNGNYVVVLAALRMGPDA